MNAVKKIITIISVCLFLSLPALAHAQLDFGGFSGFTPNYADELSIDLIPLYPKPLETVYVSLRMNTERLDSSQISWYRDGKLLLSGTGKINFSFTTPKSGSKTTLEIRVKTLNGVSFSKSINIKPATSDLIWESISYTPPFYKGKALFPPQGVIKVVAIPDFGSPAKIIYKWTLDGEVLQEESGYGKNIIFINGKLLGQQMELEMLATDPVSNATSQNFLDIKPVDPEVAFYQVDPLYGIIFDKPIRELDLKGDEVSVLAVPYNISMTGLDNIKYEWRINGLPASSILGRLAIFRKPEGQSGSSRVLLNVENESRILQSTEAGFLVKFENNENTDF